MLYRTRMALAGERSVNRRVSKAGAVVDPAVDVRGVDGTTVVGGESWQA